MRLTGRVLTCPPPGLEKEDGDSVEEEEWGGHSGLLLIIPSPLPSFLIQGAGEAVAAALWGGREEAYCKLLQGWEVLK